MSDPGNPLLFLSGHKVWTSPKIPGVILDISAATSLEEAYNQVNIDTVSLVIPLDHLRKMIASLQQALAAHPRTM